MSVTPLEKWIMEDASINGRDSMEKYQADRIKEITNYVKNNSSFYRDHFRNTCTTGISSLHDMESLPFTYSEDIAGFPSRFLCIPQKYVKRIVTLKTSGTSGTEKRIFFTEHDLSMTVDFFTNGFKAMVDENDRVMIMMPGNTYGSVGRIIKKSLDHLNIRNFIYGPLKNSDDAADFIAKNNINTLVAMPVQTMILSRIKKSVFLQNIKRVMLSADYVPAILIKKLKTEYGCQVFTHYGMTEAGYGCAVECNLQNGYHIRENDIYLEIVNPETGNVLKDGSWGEIAITTLKRQAMPLIRYRTGDWGCFETSGCQCGTFLKTLKRSKGRIGNRICFEGGRHINMIELDEVIFTYDSVLDYNMEISGDSAVTALYMLDECMSDTGKIEKSINEMFHDNSINTNVVVIARKKEDLSFPQNTMAKRRIISHNLL